MIVIFPPPPPGSYTDNYYVSQNNISWDITNFYNAVALQILNVSYCTRPRKVNQVVNWCWQKVARKVFQEKV